MQHNHYCHGRARVQVFSSNDYAYGSNCHARYRSQEQSNKVGFGPQGTHSAAISNYAYNNKANSSQISQAEPDKYKLTYFDARGRGELTRLIFAAAGVPFIDDRISFEQWGAMKGSTPFGGVCFFKQISAK